MGPIFKTEMLIDLSKANIDEKIFFDKITHQLDLEVRKKLWQRVNFAKQST